MEPPDIARKLFSKGVLNEQMHEDIIDRYTHETKRQRLDRVMTDVRSAVKNEERAFVKFIEAMEELNTIEINKLVSELKHDYSQQGTHNLHITSTFICIIFH